MDYFFDSSGLVKRYIEETGSAWVQQVTDARAGRQIYVARIAAAEVVSALVRKQPPIDPATLKTALWDLRFDLENQYCVIDVTAPLIEQAMDFAEKHRLRGYDAVQLAAAWVANRARLSARLPAVTLISSDQALNAAALAEGIPVDDPSRHP